MGIGRGIAARLVEAGGNVVVADLDREAAEAAVAELGDSGPGGMRAAPVDVSDPAGVERTIGVAIEEFGAVDILVNNAGIYPSRTLRELDLKTFRHVLDVNLTGLFLCTKAASERMIDQGTGGRIVNITSIDALHPSMVGLATYDASKHGAWGFTKNVALELAPHGIWVNAIAPGGIRTRASARATWTRRRSRASPRRSRWGASATPTRSVAPPSSSPPTWRATSPAPSSSSTAAAC